MLGDEAHGIAPAKTFSRKKSPCCRKLGESGVDRSLTLPKSSVGFNLIAP
jgi:hypothetical protein